MWYSNFVYHYTLSSAFRQEISTLQSSLLDIFYNTLIINLL